MDVLRHEQRYFNWLASFVAFNFHPLNLTFSQYTYYKLIAHLHQRRFNTILVPHDENRAKDGIDLRYQFCYENNINDAELYFGSWYYTECTILELLIALSDHIEESMMDPEHEDRTAYWFWSMIDSLYLIQMDDEVYNPKYVDKRIDIFLNRKYKPNGDGGLFTLPCIKTDLRRIEIWDQMNWYISQMIF